MCRERTVCVVHATHQHNHLKRQRLQLWVECWFALQPDLQFVCSCALFLLFLRLTSNYVLPRKLAFMHAGRRTHLIYFHHFLTNPAGIKLFELFQNTTTLLLSFQH